MHSSVLLNEAQAEWGGIALKSRPDSEDLGVPGLDSAVSDPEGAGGALPLELAERSPTRIPRGEHHRQHNSAAEPKLEQETNFSFHCALGRGVDWTGKRGTTSPRWQIIRRNTLKILWVLKF